jgi:2-keto-4-pentenoate hydratase
MSSPILEAARLLATARESRIPIKDLPPHLMPRSIEDAYAIQDLLGRERGFYGWKVGSAKNGNEPRCALLPGLAAQASPHALSRAAARVDDIELEVAVTLKKDLPPLGRKYTPADIEGAIGALHLAVELIGSRFENRNDVSQLSAIADHQSNAGVVLGAPLEDWRNVDLADLRLRVLFDGEETASASTGASLQEMLAPLAWLANHTVGRHGGLKAGQVVITGARIGPTPVDRAGTIVCEAEPFSPIRLVFEAT